MKWLKSLGVSRTAKRPQIDHPATADDLSQEWQIQTVREAISQDWISLATKNLTSEQRKAVREHLEMNVAALRELTKHNQVTY
jgi:DNA-binding GntR family transcriptional regulator